MKLTYPLPDHIVRLIDKADRTKMGLKTLEEQMGENDFKSEKELHRGIENLLRLRNIVFFHSRTDKRTTRPVGEPDFLFSVIIVADSDKTHQQRLSWPISCAWEIKLPGKRLDPEQEKMFASMTARPNSWCCRVIHSVQEALDELRKLGYGES